MANTAIVIVMQRGLVQNVYCSDADAEIVFVDWGVEPCDPSDTRVVEIKTRRRVHTAFVQEITVDPIEDLAGSMVERALDAASIGV